MPDVTTTSEGASKVAIVGAGQVGTTLAYALLLSGVASDVVLVNRDREKAEAEAADLNHAGPFTPAGRARAGDYVDIKGAFVTVLTAGASDEDSLPEGDAPNGPLDVGRYNAEIFREIVPRVVSHNPSGIILIATNPVDVLVRLALDISGLPSGRVLGSGTLVDSARLTFFLSERFGVDERSIEALILGEHGPGAVPIWSACRVGAMPMDTFAHANDLPFNGDEFSHLFAQTMTTASEVARVKGTTYYGVATAMLKIIEAIARNANIVLPIVTLPDEDTAAFYESGEVALSLPCVVNRQGVRRILKMPLHDTESALLRASAHNLEKAWQAIS
ncbi:L-lactate dehydrogenase [bacterium]|nr:MAG: L-lactate dehydrogenase [bacterium]